MTAVLLYHGRLISIMPAWPTSSPIEAFYLVDDRATETGHQLATLLRTVRAYFHLAQEHCIRETETRRPLDSWVRNTMVFYPGTSAAYESWEHTHEKTLWLALGMLAQQPLHRCTASVDFVFRVWELALELGDDVDDPAKTDVDGVLRHLSDRAQRLGMPELLLAECVVNRYTMPRYGGVFLATADEYCVAMLAALDLYDAEHTEKARVESLSFYFFDQIVRRFVPSMNPSGIDRVAALMQRTEEREQMKKRCFEAALALVSEAPRGDLFGAHVERSLVGMCSEAQAVVEIDRSTMRSYLLKLASDPTLWGTVAGVAGLAVGLPEAVAATAAVTGCSILGAHAVAASRERVDELRRSPWSLLHQ